MVTRQYKTVFKDNKTKFGFKKVKRGIEKKSINLQVKESTPTRQTLLLKIKAIGTQLQPESAEKTFDGISESELEPLFSVLMTFLSSAMSHISISHRIKGVSILKLALSKYSGLFAKYRPEFNTQLIDLLTSGKERLLVLETFFQLMQLTSSLSVAEATKIFELLVAVWIEDNGVHSIALYTLKILEFILANQNLELDVVSIMNSHFVPLFPFTHTDLNIHLVLILLKQKHAFLELCNVILNEALAGKFKERELLKAAVLKLAEFDLDHAELLQLALEFNIRQFDHISFEMAKTLIKKDPHSPAITNWFLTLPKHLWQLKGKHPEFATDIIGFISEIMQCINVTVLNKFQKVLCPIFYSTIKSTSGPVIKYPIDVQEMLIDVLFHLPPWDVDLCKVLSKVSQDARFPVTSTLRIFDISVLRQQALSKRVDFGLYQSLLISIMINDDSSNRKKLISEPEAIIGPLGKLFISSSANYEIQSDQCDVIQTQIKNSLEIDLTLPIKKMFENETIPVYTFEALIDLNIETESDTFLLAAIDASCISSSRDALASIEKIVTPKTLNALFNVYEAMIIEKKHQAAIKSIDYLFFNRQICFEQREIVFHLIGKTAENVAHSNPPAVIALKELLGQLKAK